MAIARVQGFTSLEQATSSSSGTTIARAFTSNVTAGNLIVAAVRSKMDGGSTTDAQSVTDSLSNTYTKAIGSIALSTSERVEFFYAKNITGGACTVTATWAAAVTRRAINVFEISGCDTSSPLAATNSGSGTSLAPSAGSVTTTGEAIIIAAAINTNSYNHLAAGTGWTSRDVTDIWGSALMEDRLETSSGSFSGDFSEGSSDDWAAIIAAFAVAGGATPTTALFRRTLNSLGTRSGSRQAVA